MFTGIIEAFGKVVDLEKDQENLHLSLESSLTQELKIDQSLAHNGVCLTVVEQPLIDTRLLPFKKLWKNRILGGLKWAI